MYVCMCVCMYVCVYVCTYVCLDMIHIFNLFSLNFKDSYSLFTEYTVAS